MAPDPDRLTGCDPCCTPTNYSRSTDSFRASHLITLCNILNVFETSVDQQISLQVLCDPGTGNPILVQVYYASDGSITQVKAFHMDGTPYVGDIDLLETCFQNDISPNAGNEVVEHADGLYVPAYINAGLFGDGSDGNVTLSVNTTLTRDMYYDDLTINSSSTLSPDGFRVFVKDTLTIDAGSKIDRSGNNGTNAVVNLAGIAGTAFARLNRPLNNNGSGGSGGAGSTGVGANGSVAILINASAGGAGIPGGNGGAGVSAGGNGGNSSSIAFINAPIGYLNTNPIYGTYPVQGGMGGGGGAGGGGGGGVAGGGGGGGGAGGSVLLVFARHMILNGQINANGGNGGNGGTPAAGGSAKGGGGGGGAGGGGAIFVCYQDFSGAGSINALSGTSGTGGIGQAGGTNGVTPGAASAGRKLIFDMTTQTFV